MLASACSILYNATWWLQWHTFIVIYEVAEDKTASSPKPTKKQKRNKAKIKKLKKDTGSIDANTIDKSMDQKKKLKDQHSSSSMQQESSATILKPAMEHVEE